MGPAGLEPALPGLKVRCLSNSATTPLAGRTYPFPSRCIEHRSTPLFPLASSPGWTRTDHRRLIRSPCFLYNTGPCSVGKVGLEPTISCSQNTRAGRCPTSRLSVRTAGFEPRAPTEGWSLLAPARRNTRLSHVLSVGSSYGNRTHLSALKGQYPQPIDERAVSVRTIYAQWAARAIESPSPGLQPSAIPSQLPAQRKKPDVVVTPGFVCSRRGKAKRHKRKGYMGSVFAG